jgi:hypothetical protein
MLKDGTYVAWFKTSAGSGTGIVRLMGGTITGGDSFLSYSGSYEMDADRFAALIRTQRHTPGPSSLFGVDDLTLRVTGECSAIYARCTGRAEEVPDLLFEATLMLSRPENPKPRPKSSRADFRPETLPSLPSR